MSVHVIKKEEITLLLHDWYREIRSQNFVKAKELKQSIDTKLIVWKKIKRIQSFIHF